MSLDVGERCHASRGHWADRPPRRCARGHWLLPGHMTVDTVACSCGAHVRWECECGAATYGPALIESCSVAR
ncbi:MULTISPECIES: hypothetical protein [Mycobacterium]|uniref:hypothetical protein n=1 Tax=Mycobacterium TaxID=1763 RepID=UPI001EF06F73|nr:MULTISPECIES: hypothetical protein [Mycobacterium]